MLNVVVTEYGKLESGRIAISAKLTNDAEVDDAINNLICELEILRTNAKKILSTI